MRKIKGRMRRCVSGIVYLTLFLVVDQSKLSFGKTRTFPATKIGNEKIDVFTTTHSAAAVENSEGNDGIRQPVLTSSMGTTVNSKFDPEINYRFPPVLFDSNVTNGTDPFDYIPWDQLHIVKVQTTTSEGILRSAGALVQDRIVVTCCQCIQKSENVDPYSYMRGDDELLEEAIQITRGSTGEVRYVDRMSFGIRRYCVDDPNTHIGQVLILTKPFNVEPMQLTLGRGCDFCRFYAFLRRSSSNPEPSRLGHHDLRAFRFIPNTSYCYRHGNVTNWMIVCGVVQDWNQEFCSLTVGAVVLCDLKLMGVSQTTCKVPYFRTNSKKTRVLTYVSIMTKEEQRYWQKLIDMEGDDDKSSDDREWDSFLISSFVMTVTITFYHI